MKDTFDPEDQNQLIEAIKSNDEFVLKRFYTENYPKVEAMVLSNSGSKDQSKDIYQEAFISVWQNIKLNKFIPLNKTALNGYLYTIAKNKWLDYLKSSHHKKTNAMYDVSHAKDFQNDTQDEAEFELQLEKTTKAMEQLENPCKSLLLNFYYKKTSLRDIAKELNIGEATARNKKYRCMEKLRELIISGK